MLVNLKNQKLIVSFQHNRNMLDMSPHATYCFIKDASTKDVVGSGFVTKHHNDAPNLRYARKCAIERALFNMHMTREERRDFWDQIWQQMRK